MKQDIHPQYNHVLYIDGSTKTEWVSRSTASSGEKREIDGVEHFVIRLDISSESHPFFTGKQRLVDSEGRIDRWRRKYAQAAKSGNAPDAAAAADAPAAADATPATADAAAS